MSKLLINEKTLVLLPSLAVKIGLNEAIVLQQIHYWLSSSSHVIEGRRWVYNTYKDWNKQLPFWSESTIKRTIMALEDLGYLISANFNRSKMDKTKWYTIDYEKLELMDGEEPEESCPGQPEPSAVSESDLEDFSKSQAIPEITTEITSKNTTEKKEILPFSEIIQYLNEKTYSAYNPNTRKTMELIRARFREGFTLAEFKKVIDHKAAEWLNDPKWSKYLRPETLFGTKFEAYLNQKPAKRRLRGEDLNLHD
ncbi:replication protein [Peribacillus cavernae]|uniref:Replication protein n=1 Tax=Peribacillus cavernae TaxID=1674310 RepID=A0A433HGE8_9BACI|nr:conserved phage C-terminal domain-containing protein [Peribacillus cavernae]MDQ0221345.1 putative phage protein (TIGR02220 family) [Peribacillus cavernae]RUQ27476.1 replication protein [Peribacillus cavernae]